MDPIPGEASLNKRNVYDDEVDSIKSEIMKKIQSNLDIGEDFGVEFVFDEAKLCSGLIKIKGNQSISIFNTDDGLKLEEASQLLINENNKPLEMPRKYKFQISSIDVNSFKVISKEEVEKRNREVISILGLGERQGSHMDDMSKLGFKIPDSDDINKVPIEFKHSTVNHVVAISEPIDVDLIIMKLPKQIESPAFEAKKKELQAFKDDNEVLLKGSKIMDSIKTTLEKNTQGDLKARYESLKESIKQPVETANREYKESLTKIALAHNSFIDAQIKKTSAAALETRKKYKMTINKTKKAVEDRLDGKSKGILGKITGSKLQKLGKSLDSDQSEIEDEIAKAKRYTSIKETLLNWSEASQDKSKLSEAQIETIVEAFKIEGYEVSVNAFIENLKRNTMSIISLILEEFDLKLDVFEDTAAYHLPKFLDIVKKIMESLLKMINAETLEVDTDKVEGVLKNTIAAYARPTNNDYLTPMKLQDIKATMLAILQSSKSTSSDRSDTVSESSMSTSSINSNTNISSLDRKRELAKNRAVAARNMLDTFTPAINELEAVISEYIPDIKSGELLLTTEREVKSFLRKGTGEMKEKHYFLDVAGNVRKIGSTITYKLAIKDDGSIPPQLSPSSKFSQLTRLVGTSSQSRSSMPASLDDMKIQDVYPSKPRFNFSSFNPVSSKPVYGPVEAPLYGPDPAPKRMIPKGYNAIKGFKNYFNKTSKPTQGGRRRTHKNRKNKTRRNKKYGRR